MFRKEVFLVGCNFCFRSEYTFSVCIEEEGEKKAFFRIDYIPENYAEVFDSYFPDLHAVLVKLKKVTCRK